ncbi:MAG: hypothetical protein R3B60_01995 [Candidatus Paceibacterota bacterium]
MEKENSEAAVGEADRRFTCFLSKNVNIASPINVLRGAENENLVSVVLIVDLSCFGSGKNYRYRS